MKRSFFYLAALGVMTLSACTSEDVIDEGVQANVIGFNNVVKKQSRASDDAVIGDLTNDNLDKFVVYGYYTKANMTATAIQVFGGDVITLKDKATNSWDYANPRYWVPGATYNFYAYSCADVVLDNTKGTPALNTTAVNSQDRVLTINNFICDNTHKGHDLIYARNENNVGRDPKDGVPNAKIGFTFNHVLTKINYEFVSDFDQDYTVYVTDVLIENFRNKGNYHPTKGWLNVVRDFGSNETSPILLNFDFPKNNTCRKAGDEVEGSTAVTGSNYVIPYLYDEPNVQLKFKIEVRKGNDVVFSRNMTGTWRPQWQVGYSYTYTINLTGTVANLEPIVFETATDMNLGWTPGASQNTNMTFSTN